MKNGAFQMPHLERPCFQMAVKVTVASGLVNSLTGSTLRNESLAPAKKWGSIHQSQHFLIRVDKRKREDPPSSFSFWDMRRAATPKNVSFFEKHSWESRSSIHCYSAATRMIPLGVGAWWHRQLDFHFSPSSSCQPYRSCAG